MQIFVYFIFFIFILDTFLHPKFILSWNAALTSAVFIWSSQVVES